MFIMVLPFHMILQLSDGHTWIDSAQLTFITIPNIILVYAVFEEYREWHYSALTFYISKWKVGFTITFKINDLFTTFGPLTIVTSFTTL